MIDRIRQVGHLCRPFDVAKKILILKNIYYTNVNNESILWKHSFKLA